MKLKLKEAAQPISKLDYNIQNVILPELAKYGLVFNTIPTRVTPNKNIYSGINKNNNSTAKLELNNTNDEISVWNDAGNDFIADLFGTLWLGSKEVNLGPMSSRDPSSVVDAIDPALRDEQIERKKEKEKAREASLIPPKYSDKNRKGINNMSPKTEEEWKETAKKAQEVYNKANAEFKDKYTWEQQNQLRTDYAEGKEVPEDVKKIFTIFKNYYGFMGRVYPLDDEYAKAYERSYGGYKEPEGIGEI